MESGCRTATQPDKGGVGSHEEPGTARRWGCATGVDKATYVAPPLPADEATWVWVMGSCLGWENGTSRAITMAWALPLPCRHGRWHGNCLHSV
jgi:hypothetical protein